MQAKKNRQVFITGASGFVGANIVRALQKEKYQITVFQRSNTINWRLEEIQNSINIIVGDITNFKDVKNAIAVVKPDYIIHLATYGAYPHQQNIDKIIKVNIIGTKNLLKATKDIPYSCFINTGSSSEYGVKTKAMKETDSCEPVSFYGAAKLAQTQLCKVFAEKYKKPIVTLRLFSVYGPYEEPTRFIPVIQNALIDHKPIQLTKGIYRRDFIYINDIVALYKKVMETSTKLLGEVYNVGTGIQYTNDEVVQTLFSVTTLKTNISKEFYPKRSWDTPNWVADITKTSACFNWKPKYTLSEGLKKSFDWFVQNRRYYK